MIDKKQRKQSEQCERNGFKDWLACKNCERDEVACKKEIKMVIKETVQEKVKVIKQDYKK